MIHFLKNKNKPFKALSTSWIDSLSSLGRKCLKSPKKGLKLDLFYNIAFWEHLMACLVALFMLYGCGQIKYVPMQTEEKEIIRDSIIRVIDTVKVEVPFETIKEVLPQIDTSILETSVAKSVAYVDTLEKKLHHTLEQKGELKVQIDTCYITQTVEKIVYKDRPVEVQVPKRDSIFWYSIIGNILFVFVIILRFVLKGNL